MCLLGSGFGKAHSIRLYFKCLAKVFGLGESWLSSIIGKFNSKIAGKF